MAVGKSGSSQNQNQSQQGSYSGNTQSDTTQSGSVLSTGSTAANPTDAWSLISKTLQGNLGTTGLNPTQQQAMGYYTTPWASHGAQHTNNLIDWGGQVLSQFTTGDNNKANLAAPTSTVGTGQVVAPTASSFMSLYDNPYQFQVVDAAKADAGQALSEGLNKIEIDASRSSQAISSNGCTPAVVQRRFQVRPFAPFPSKLSGGNGSAVDLTPPVVVAFAASTRPAIALSNFLSAERTPPSLLPSRRLGAQVPAVVRAGADRTLRLPRRQPQNHNIWWGGGRLLRRMLCYGLESGVGVEAAEPEVPRVGEEDRPEADHEEEGGWTTLPPALASSVEVDGVDEPGGKG